MAVPDDEKAPRYVRPGAPAAVDAAPASADPNDSNDQRG